MSTISGQYELVLWKVFGHVQMTHEYSYPAEQSTSEGAGLDVHRRVIPGGIGAGL